MEITFDTLLALAFSLWALVVAALGWGFRRDFRDIKEGVKGVRSDLQNEAERLNKYIVQTETRLAVLEDRINNKSG